MLIYIVRHGETEMNKLAVLQGRMDEPLNEAGRYLAHLTGRAMKDIRFDECISSPLVRAKETVEIILRENEHPVEVETDDRLMEIAFGDMEGKKAAEMGLEGKLLFSDPFAFRGAANGERIRDVCERTQAFLKELIARDDGRTYLIGTHGCALRAMLNFLYGDPADFWHGHAPYNCAVNIVEAKGGTARLVADDRIYYPPEYAVDRYRT